MILAYVAVIVGRWPLVLPRGPVSPGRQAIGPGVFFGMFAAAAIGILLVPFFFVYIYKLKAALKQKALKVKRA